MSTFVDIPMEPDAIQEEEELIEAVEALVETCAVSVKQSLVQDWHELQTKVNAALEWAFPVLVEYKQHTRSLSDDLHSLALATLMFVVVFFVLAPSTNTSERSSTQTHHHHPIRKVRSQFLKTARSESYSGSDEDESATSSDHRGGGGGGWSTRSAGGASSDTDETDEERFEKVYPGISVSPYRLLVLPPTCRRVEKPMVVLRQPSLQRLRSTPGAVINVTSAATPTRTNVASNTNDNPQRRTDGTRSTNSISHADDNPARRLQFYVGHVLFLLKKLISYDYAGAGWTLWQWLQSYIRRRRMARQSKDDASVVSASNNNNNQSVTATSSMSTDPALSPRKLQQKEVMAPDSPGVSSVMDLDESDYDDDFDGPLGMPSRGALPLHALLEEEKKGEDDTNVSPMSSHVQATAQRRDLLRSIQSSHRRQSSESTVYHDLDKETPSISGTPIRALSSANKNLLKKISVSLRKREDVEGDSHLPESEKDGSPPLHEESNEQLPDEPPFTSPVDNTTITASSPSAAVTKQLLKSSDSAFYFETAGCHESLKKMSIELPVPDRNGYILGDDFLPDSRYTPLLVFVNSRAGPQQGHLLITQLRRLLNPIQVWDLAEGGPEAVLESFLVFTRLRILVCGGDGTVSWIVSVLEGMKSKIRPKKWPPIAILPLGTGNDLARIHGWGGGYNNESLITILEQISESYISLLDIWEVAIDSKQAKKKEVKTFFNYLGVGADAQAALQVHYLRESRPEWFFSRVVNKLWYGVFGAEDLLLSSSVNVRKEIKLLADGVEVSIPPDSQGIIILNIDSYAGGVPLWSHGTKSRSVTVRPLKSPRRSQSMNMMRQQSSLSERVDSLDDLQMLLSEEERIDRVTACDMESSCQDGVLEIVSIRGAFHLGQIKVGLSNAQRLCQCREAVITIKNNVPVQVDGEPWRQRPCTLTIRRKQAQAVMLHRSADDGGVETEMSKLLDWAEERKIIDAEVHSILMKEYSRRIESKTRRRRVKEQDNIMHTLKKAISQSAIGNNLHASHNWQGGIAF